MATHYFVIAHHLVAAAVRQEADQRGVPYTALAEACGIQLPTMSRILLGSQDLRLSRICRIADALKMHPEELLVRARSLAENAVGSRHVTLLADYPSEPPKAPASIIRAHDLSRWLADKEGAEFPDILATGFLREDDVWRARIAARMNYVKAGAAFGVEPTTVRQWERYKFPHFWDPMARKVYRIAS